MLRLSYYPLRLLQGAPRNRTVSVCRTRLLSISQISSKYEKPRDFETIKTKKVDFGAEKGDQSGPKTNPAEAKEQNIIRIIFGLVLVGGVWIIFKYALYPTLIDQVNFFCNEKTFFAILFFEQKKNFWTKFEYSTVGEYSNFDQKNFLFKNQNCENNQKRTDFECVFFGSNLKNA